MSNHLRLRHAALLAAGCVFLAFPAGAAGSSSDFDISQQIGPDPLLPDPDPALVANMKVANVIGWKDGEMPKVADGLTITPYATDLANPRTVHTLPNGDVLVVQSRGPSGEPVSRPKDVIRGWIMSIAHGSGDGEPKKSNRITLLRDTNRDGKVDESHELLTDLNSPFGVAWIDDTLYVADTDAILAYPYKLGDTELAAEPTVLSPLPGGPIDHHWTKDLALSPDGSKLYAGVGSNSNIVENGIEAEKGRAAIWEIDRKTGASRIYASGLRNPNGLTFNRDSGELWAVINERDELGPNLVPDYMTSVKDGAFYGWPWSYYGNHVDNRVRPQRPDMVEKAIAPDYALSSHVAPLGMTFTGNSAMPEAYRTGAFVGEHGSWNRDFFNGYRVVYIPFKNGKPAGKAQDVVTGFIDGDNAHGRPVGLGIDGTGALLIADDAGNSVWRVAAADGSVTPAPIGTDQFQTSSISPASEPDTASMPDSAAQPAAQLPASATGSGSADEKLTGQQPATAAASGDGVPNPSQTQMAPAVLPGAGGAKPPAPAN